MPYVEWQGNTTARAQSGTVTVSAGFDSDTSHAAWILTVTDEAGKTFVVSTSDTVFDTDDTTTTVATTLTSVWNAAENEAASRVTATSSGAVVTLTADTTGVPFTVASSVVKSGGAGAIGAYTAVTANAGPEDWKTAENWSGGALPTNNDEIVIPAGTPAIRYGLVTGISANSFRIQGHSNVIGGTDRAYLSIAAADTAEVEISKPGGQMWLDLGSSNPNPTSGGIFKVTNTDIPVEGQHGLYLKGTALTNVYIFRGNVGFGVDGDDTTSECNNFYIGSEGALASDAYLRIGKWVTNLSGGIITLIDKEGGTVILEADVGATTVKQRTSGGYFESRGIGPITGLTVSGGEARLNSNGTVATLTCEGGTTTTMHDDRTRTVTTLKMNPRNGDAEFIWNKAVVTLTNKITTDDDKVVFKARTRGT